MLSRLKMNIVSKSLFRGLALLAVVFSSFSQAEAVDKKILQTISDRLAAARPDLRVVDVQKSPVLGLYAAQIENGPVIYASADGSHFITGDLYKVEAKGIVNLAEAKRAKERIGLMAGLKAKDMIVFAPSAPMQTKATVTVFTDIDCGYCRKLHREVPELNKLGIAVRYMAYPRAGVGSDSYNKLVTAWCSDEPSEALTALKNSQSVATKTCQNPVADHYMLGQRLGVTGTPALVTEDGRLLPGYMPAKDLAATLGVSG